MQNLGIILDCIFPFFFALGFSVSQNKADADNDDEMAHIGLFIVSAQKQITRKFLF